VSIQLLKKHIGLAKWEIPVLVYGYYVFPKPSIHGSRQLLIPRIAAVGTSFSPLQCQAWHGYGVTSAQRVEVEVGANGPTSAPPSGAASAAPPTGANSGAHACIMEEDQARDASGDQHRRERQHRSPLQPLKYKHFTQIFKVAWNKPFTREWNMRGWEKEGLLPRFNRKENWHFKAGLDTTEANGATASSKRRSNNTKGTSSVGTPPSTEGNTSRATEVHILMLSGGLHIRATRQAASDALPSPSTSGGEPCLN
jgi:hypothetical protein